MSSGDTEQIVRAVEARADRVVQLLRDLVQIDSHTGHESDIQRYLARKMTDMGLDVDVFEPDIKRLEGHPAYYPVTDLDFRGRPNVVGTLPGTPDARSLILNGHVDTVPADAEGGWEAPPLSGLVENGILYGRGAADMKSGVAAMIMAVQTLLEIGLRPRGRIVLQAVVDEELTGYGTLACLERGYIADAAICAETSDLQIMPACIGRLWFAVEVRGKSAGIATRWLAVSAIEKALKVIGAVEELERMRIQDLTHPLYPDNRMALPCVVTMFNAGTFPSATPEVAILRGSMGLMPYEDVEEVKQQFCEQIRLMSQGDAWLRHHLPAVSFKDVGADGAEIPAGHPIVETVAEAFQQTTQRQAVIAGRTGGADSRYLIKYGGIPTVIFGPGETAKMHMVNESVPVSNVVDATKTLALAVHRWCN